jgi:HSP20 family protein
MSLIPRYTQELAPMLRFFDDYERHAFRDLATPFRSLRSFRPRFDVTETPHTYELHGELPGIEQKDVTIEWNNSTTLSISGHHQHGREEGERPKGFIEAAADVEKSQPNKYPSVEAEGAEQEKQGTANKEAATQNDGANKCWVSERSVGSFHRSFAFPARVDQDAVKASLKNGILSVVVPKRGGEVRRRVEIE